MSSTNKTSNYNLSQFVGSDKPAWLADYNSDMSKIDTGIHNAATTATAADGKGDANTTAIGTLTNLTTTDKTSLVAAVNEVDANADTAQETANVAATTATQAKSTADGLSAYLTLNVGKDCSVSTNKGTLGSVNTVAVRTNSTGSLAKIYSSNISITNLDNNTGNLVLTVADTGLRPTTAITFNGCAFIRVEDKSSHIYRQLIQPYTLNTDGTITAERSLASLNATSVAFQFMAVVLFITDFGDIAQD